MPKDLCEDVGVLGRLWEVLGILMIHEISGLFAENVQGQGAAGNMHLIGEWECDGCRWVGQEDIFKGKYGRIEVMERKTKNNTSHHGNKTNGYMCDTYQQSRHHSTIETVRYTNTQASETELEPLIVSPTSFISFKPLSMLVYGAYNLIGRQMFDSKVCVHLFSALS